MSYDWQFIFNIGNKVKARHNLRKWWICLITHIRKKKIEQGILYIMPQKCNLDMKEWKHWLTLTLRLMMSAKRDNTFSEHSPRIEGSTILVRESMSWSWESAHLTRCCSARGRELHISTKQTSRRMSTSTFLYASLIKHCRFCSSLTCHMVYDQSKVLALPHQNCRHHFDR
jgi:hypothetical protein